MTELEKLHAGLEYDMWAPEIDALEAMTSPIPAAT